MVCRISRTRKCKFLTRIVTNSRPRSPILMTRRMKFPPLVASLLLAATCLRAQSPAPPSLPSAPSAAELFGPQNIHAWCVVPFDARKRGPEERAAMFEKLGIKRFVYDWRAKDIPTFDAEIEALKNHG